MKNKFNTFADIEHKPLRVFNRVVTLSNLNEDSGPVISKQYIELFNKDEVAEMITCLDFIKKHGAKAARAAATEGMVFEDEAYVG